MGGEPAFVTFEALLLDEEEGTVGEVGSCSTTLVVVVVQVFSRVGEASSSLLSMFSMNY